MVGTKVGPTGVPTEKVMSGRPSRPIHETPIRVVKRIGKELIMPYRHLTSAGRILPSFVIIGAQKCGTTSLFKYLAQHPQVIKGIKKEIDFFDAHFERGMRWYQAHFPYALHRRWRDMWLSGRSITGEASTDYILDPEAPARAYRTLPDLKLIALLRNPVDRAYSHYHHRLRYWQESRTFEDAITSELEWIRQYGYRRLLTESSEFARNVRRHSYLLRGIYADQLSSWAGYFPSEQLLVLNSDALFDDPAELFGSVSEFLDLDRWSPARFDAYNRFVYGDMNPSSRDRLAEFFRSHNERLYGLIGARFDWEHRSSGGGSTRRGEAELASPRLP